MATVTRNIDFTVQQDRWISDQIADGWYGDASELVRDLVEQCRSQASTEPKETGEDIERIRAALTAAEAHYERFGPSKKTVDEIWAETQAINRKREAA